MGLSKVYRGYVIEDVNGQWYIRNAPNYLNGFPFSPGPHGGWTVATHQVDTLHEYLNREKEKDRVKYVPRQIDNSRHDFQNYSGGSSSSGGFFGGLIFFILSMGFFAFLGMIFGNGG